MFELLKEKHYLDVNREQIMRLMMSFNDPMVATSGHSVQPARAYIITLKSAPGFEVYIYLYLTTDKEGIIYKYTDELPTEASSKDAEDEAVQFTEEMGHLIDDLKFNYLEVSEQMKLISYLPIFSPKYDVGEKARVEKPGETIETIEPIIEEMAETKETKEEKGFEPEIFLSKFRMRAALEKRKREDE